LLLLLKRYSNRRDIIVRYYGQGIATEGQRTFVLCPVDGRSQALGLLLSSCPILLRTTPLYQDALLGGRQVYRILDHRQGRGRHLTN
jgi:hypothetical protein